MLVISDNLWKKKNRQGLPFMQWIVLETEWHSINDNKSCGSILTEAPTLTFYSFKAQELTSSRKEERLCLYYTEVKHRKTVIICWQIRTKQDSRIAAFSTHTSRPNWHEYNTKCYFYQNSFERYCLQLSYSPICVEAGLMN